MQCLLMNSVAMWLNSNRKTPHGQRLDLDRIRHPAHFISKDATANSSQEDDLREPQQFT